MGVKIVSAIVATLLFVAFLAVVVLKLREIPLVVVVLIGIALMAVDLWQSLREGQDR
jgi:hypothetical protein